MRMNIGVLAFHGDVLEHMQAMDKAAVEEGLGCSVLPVRTKDALEGLDGLIIPGGESTTLYKLCVREGMLGPMRRMKGIFGTCAGAIMLAKTLRNAEQGQGTLGLMDIEVDRNAYGRQDESFEDSIETGLGPMHAVFIRAPRILSVGRGVAVLAERGGEALACEQRAGGRYYLASCFHPELTSTLFHRHFIRSIRR
jgi:5'-phosphate synthase pdxT subunit